MNQEYAFPCPMSEQTHSNQDCAPFQNGMTLRDYFAAKAMSGFLAVPGGINPQADANLAYLIADAMLAARAKGGEA